MQHDYSLVLCFYDSITVVFFVTVLVSVTIVSPTCLDDVVVEEIFPKKKKKHLLSDI